MTNVSYSHKWFRGGTAGTGMMIEWNDEWLVGHAVIDYDHRTLVNITNQVYAMKRMPNISNAQVLQVLKHLTDYVERHFAREEEIFLATDYPEKKAHIAMHRQLEKVVKDIVDCYRREPDLLNLDEISNFLRRWLIDHILKHDHAYRPFLGPSAKVAVGSL